MSDAKPIVGVLLAGGLARRMGGGDKPLRELGGKPILEHVIDRAKPQVHHLILNANGDPGRFAKYSLPVVADIIDGHQGPLAGILTALDWAAEHVPEAEHVVSFATDAPFLPRDLTARLLAAVATESTPLACAITGERTHPVFGIWPVARRDELRQPAQPGEDVRERARTALADCVFRLRGLIARGLVALIALGALLGTLSALQAARLERLAGMDLPGDAGGGTDDVCPAA